MFIIFQLPSTALTYDVPGLITGKDYMFRVMPTNIAGIGDAIQPESPITVKSSYSKSHSNTMYPKLHLWSQNNFIYDRYS